MPEAPNGAQSPYTHLKILAHHSGVGKHSHIYICAVFSETSSCRLLEGGWRSARRIIHVDGLRKSSSDFFETRYGISSLNSVHETKREGNGWPESLCVASWPKRPSISSGTPHYQRNDGGDSPTEPASACACLADYCSPEIKKRIRFACAWFLEEEQAERLSPMHSIFPSLPQFWMQGMMFAWFSFHFQVMSCLFGPRLSLIKCSDCLAELSESLRWLC